MNNRILLTGILLITVGVNCQAQNTEPINEIFIRINQLGYLPDDLKIAIVFSKSQLNNAYLELIAYHLTVGAYDTAIEELDIVDIQRLQSPVLMIFSYYGTKSLTVSASFPIRIVIPSVRPQRLRYVC